MKIPEGYETARNIALRFPLLNAVSIAKYLEAAKHPSLPRTKYNPKLYKSEGVDAIVYRRMLRSERFAHRTKRLREECSKHEEDIVMLTGQAKNKPIGHKLPLTDKALAIFNHSGPYSQKDIISLLMLFADGYRDMSTHEQTEHAVILLRDILRGDLVLGIGMKKR
jgi:hypothetical protein